MSLDIAPPPDRIGVVEPPRGGGQVTRNRPAWMDQNLITAILLAIGGYALGHYLGNVIASGYTHIGTSTENNVAIILGLVLAVVGWLLGIGVFNYPLARMAGLQPAERVEPQNWTRYFRMAVDHKTVGMQYLIGIFTFLFTGGLLAMAIRTELLSPTSHIYGPGTYIQIVGEHGTIMMMMASSIVVGPLGNYLVPLMIGSRRMAFPRVEAASFWIFASGYFVILSALVLGGFPTGWTGYAPLQTQANLGMDSYLVGFSVIGTGMILAGFNLLVTVIHYRAPGMTWGRVPVFVWSIVATSALLTLATPTLAVACYFGILDRAVPTALYVNIHGGNSYLWEDLFWFFGHPEVYIMALPGFGIVAELLPVFTRRPLFGYRIATAGMIGVALLSFFVWQHHLFQSGIDPAMRPLFMLTTELISIPTGFVYLVGLGTLWKAKVRFEVPMLFCLALYFNFLFGGVSGVFLSDVPVNVTVHGGFFVLSHFHYTILGGLVFGFFGGVYYWFPKMTGRQMNQRLGKIHFWTMFIFFNLTFFPLFLVGLFDQPRRVFEYANNLQGLNDFASISAFCLGASFLIFIYNFIWSMWISPVKAAANPWGSKGLEWQTESPPPVYNFEHVPVVLNDPYTYGEPGALPVADMSGAQFAAVGAEQRTVDEASGAHTYPPADGPGQPTQ